MEIEVAIFQRASLSTKQKPFLGDCMKEGAMRITDKGVCVPGFRAGSSKKYSGHSVAIIASEGRITASLMLTNNRIKAAPVIVSQEHYKKGELKAVVANSGCANAYTGRKGLRDARKMCELAAKELSLNTENMIVASTGIIGRKLDMDAIDRSIKEASILRDNGKASMDAVKALMTTDRFPKMVSVETRLKSGEVVEVGGIAKGAGMIAPQLTHATMLCFITTNAKVPRYAIDGVLEEAVEQSFNSTVVDGDTSTNDTVALLANGMAGNADVDENFQSALNYVAKELAKLIAKDGEGATKLIEVEIRRARTTADATKAARAIASSNLVKAAFYGEDPNWGRIVSALGYSGAKFHPEKISLSFESKKGRARLVERGAIAGKGEVNRARRIMGTDEIRVVVDLAAGKHTKRAYGCDLTPDYVKLNAHYST